VLVDLVRITTRDGCQLDGILQTAAASPKPPMDAFCLVHGTGSNFYGSSLMEALADRLLCLGIAVLRVNTRGHDGISNTVTAKGGLRLGAAYEVVDDCRHDLAGWLDFLRQRVGPRVGLLGHSMGAVKCLYALAHEPQPLGGVIALSPPRLSYEWFCRSSSASEFLPMYQQAEGHVAAGRGNTLLEVTVPLPMVISAAGYVDKYGPQERYNYLRFIRGLSLCPVLFTFGGMEVEKNVAFQEAPAELALRRPNFHVEVIARADHFYSGVRPELLQVLERWLHAL